MSWNAVRAWRDIMRENCNALPPSMQHPKTLRAGVEIALDALSDDAISVLARQQVDPYRSAALVLARTVPTACLEWCAVFLGWGSQVTIKPPTGTQHLAHWFVSTASEAGLPLSVTSDRAVLGQADVVIAMGRDESIQQIGAPLPSSTSYVGLGERFSAAWVDAPEQWERLAQDIALHDTRGCMSPTAIYTPLPFQRACENLQQALDHVAKALPKGDVLPYEAAAIRARRQLAAATTGVALASEHGEVHGLRTSPQPPASLPRCVAVYGAETPEEMSRLLSPSAKRLSTIGAPSGAHKVFRKAFPNVRVCEAGQMQRPPLHRLHDGLDWIARTHR